MRIRYAFFIGAEGVFVRMRPRVDGRDVRHRRIGEQHGAVTSDEVAAIESLADEERVVIRLVLVRRVKLEESLVVAGENERNTTEVDGAASGVDPERGVGAAQQELGARWGRDAGRGV